MQSTQDHLAAEFPEADHLSREDLQDLLSDPTYFDAFFGTCARVQALDQAKDQMLAANEELCAATLSHRASLDALRRDTAAAFDHAQQLRAQWPAIAAEQDQAYQKLSGEALLARLRAAIAQDERESEKLAQSFQDGDLDDEEFVKQYRALRRQLHRRALLNAKAPSVSL